MPTLTGSVTTAGALVDVLIGISGASVQVLRIGRRPVPSPLAARGTIDTGAEITCVDKALIQALALPLGGTALANLPAHGGVTISARHDVTLTVVHPSGNARDSLVLPNLRVLEIDLAYLGYQVLLGRDLLAKCRFVYDGPPGKFELNY